MVKASNFNYLGFGKAAKELVPPPEDLPQAFGEADTMGKLMAAYEELPSTVAPLTKAAALKYVEDIAEKTASSLAAGVAQWFVDQRNFSSRVVLSKIGAAGDRAVIER